MYDEDEGGDGPFGHDMLDGKLGEDSGDESLLTESEDRIYTESLHSEIEEAGNDLDLDVGNPINTIKVDKFRLCKQLPKNILHKEEIEKPVTPSADAMSEESVYKSERPKLDFFATAGGKSGFGKTT